MDDVKTTRCICGGPLGRNSYIYYIAGAGLTKYGPNNFIRFCKDCGNRIEMQRHGEDIPERED